MKLQLKCKNHRYISDYVPETRLGDMKDYGLLASAMIYLIHLPRIFWHQVVCPDNPALHAKSMELYARYGKHPEDTNHIYKITEHFTMQIYKTKQKTLTFIGI